MALDAVWLANGECDEQASGLIVCVVDNGVDLAIDDIARILAGSDDAIRTPFGDIPIPDIDLPISARGGTTYGNVFVTRDPDDLDPKKADLLAHELIHTFQWAAGGDVNYAQLYVRESLSSFRQGTTISYKRGIKWISRWGVPVPAPYVYPSVRLGDPGCLNRFEIHAHLSDGGYDHC